MTNRETAEAGAAASRALLSIPAAVRQRALELMAQRLTESQDEIFAANRADCAASGAGPHGAGTLNPPLSPALQKRLEFGPQKLTDVLAEIKSIAALPDPTGRVLESRELDSGLILRRVSTTLGLIMMIFEARPDALIQMAALCAKSGNALIAKGGSEAGRSNAVLGALLAKAGEDAGLPRGWLTIIQSRQEAEEFLKYDDLISLVIPRGSSALVRHIMDTSRIPVLAHAAGICHVYVHSAADIGMASRVAVDSKAQYPAACNAAEVLLVDEEIARRALPPIAAALEAAGVSLELDPPSNDILTMAAALGEKGLVCSRVSLKRDDSWSVEYLDLRMAVKVVKSIDEAIDHINRFGSHHTDTIITSSREAARHFMDGVDSASVYWNASTRFADGYRYGLGAEVGISTGKLHARGPVGLQGLQTCKWKLEGNGSLVADYASGARIFTHKERPSEEGRYYEDLE